MSSIKTTKMSNFRWVICGLLFLATTINYMDRQVLSLTWKDFIAPDFHWTDDDYGTITGLFSVFYAVANLFAGKFIDWMGTKKGYLIAIFVWSVGACMHAACGWGAIGLAGGSIVALTTISVWLFLACRMILAVGEAGNFPAAIKVTAEYFPKKDRAFATSIFNSGASVGALAAPATIPLLARACGWEMAFIIIGVLGFFWMGLWAWLYEKPARNQRVNQAELNYIEQDSDIAEVQDRKNVKDDEETISFWKCFTFRQTWSFIVGKFMTDGVWWFFLFWAPAYFSDVYHYTSDSPMGILLIFTLYAIVTVVSIGGGYLPKYFVEKRGMNPYLGRMRAMFIFACFPLLGLLAQPLGAYSAWWPAILIGFLGAGHQAWSANLYSTIGDMFPKSTIGTITGIGTMAGGLASFAINKGSGAFFTWADGKGELFSFFGFEGKPAAYMVVFSLCAVAYLIGWFIMKSLVPKYKPISLD
ncbi:MFS transporter [Prevotella sp. E15-22]|jgi:ACS family hexuronate transporter-like MFS transporter|uniref:MFS transporter n=1 Tax=Prevotella sp. E15-22 TaxID=2937774 RepID=UPI0020455A49|nr:MFS transporter [Prevotella sp. E15-22]UPS45025.1 MFS transporter [Prevotella sp. E15-22]